VIQQASSSLGCTAGARLLYFDAAKWGMTRGALPKGQPRFRIPYIRAWREAAGYSLEYVASRVPMDKGNLSKVERGLLPYNQEMIERLSDVLNVEPWALIGRDPTKDGKVIDMVARLNQAELAQAERILEALFQRA
jgi:transcriptional regulator with XRE-family HTH domain